MRLDSQLTFDFASARSADVLALIAAAAEWVGGLSLRGLAAAERKLLAEATGHGACGSCVRLSVADDAEAGLAERLSRARSIAQRRALGQFFTPQAVVEAMVAWVAGYRPRQVVDAGCGTGRFALAAARALPDARIIAVDVDPAATLLCRALVRKLSVGNVEVRCADYLHASLPVGSGPVAFIGNPPYVRHHRLPAELKRWGAAVSKRLGISFSKLAGLHVYFFLATALRARPGDLGCFITSAEWLDVGYGAGLRQLLVRNLGLHSVCLLNESVAAFGDAMTSAAITCFRAGERSRRVKVSTVSAFDRADGPPGSRRVPIAELQGRWSPVIRGASAPSTGPDARPLRLGDLFAVHRGIATGANEFFVMERQDAEEWGLAAFAEPVVTTGKQILEAGGCLRATECKMLILLPRDLDRLAGQSRRAVSRYLARGVKLGVPERYLCRHRSPWWWLGNPEPAPIVASYMARRPPAFALNPDGVHILNIAHGLFPRRPMTDEELAEYTQRLNRASAQFVGRGRRYQGGLEKFEPSEMEELMLGSADCTVSGASHGRTAGLPASRA